MKRWLPLPLTIALCLVCHVSQAEVRTWTDASGKFEIEAEFVDCSGTTVRLKKLDGKSIQIELRQLNASDQAFVRELTGQDSQAMIELISGAKVNGRITARTASHVSVETKVGERDISRTYPIDRVEAITIDGVREVVNEAGSETASAGDTRSRREVEALIDRLGREQPDWFESVPLDFPETLDLAWPARPPGDWNARRNVGQYTWEVINPNPGKWQSGVRFMHHMLELHKDNPQNRTRAMNDLGRMYHGLLQDHARAAFWWRQVGVDRGGAQPQAVKLAECYWKLGNKQMATDLLNRTNTYFTTIKLLADMGETDKALRIVEAAANQGTAPEMAYLYAGDACRIKGDYTEAIDYYQRVVSLRAVGQFQKRIQRCQQRAQANIAAIRVFDMLDMDEVAAGTYRANAAGYVGPVYVEVVVEAGRIESVKVTQHKEKQFYSSITDTPRQIVQQQGVRGVDAVTSATITSEAIINATAKALAQGMR